MAACMQQKKKQIKDAYLNAISKQINEIVSVVYPF